MKTQYQPSFIKDLKALKSSSLFESIKKIVFEDIPNYKSLNQIAHLKKIKGANNTYRIRLGDYHIGIILDQDTIIFGRVLHRKDIYRNFP